MNKMFRLNKTFREFDCKDIDNKHEITKLDQFAKIYKCSRRWNTTGLITDNNNHEDIMIPEYERIPMHPENYYIRSYNLYDLDETVNINSVKITCDEKTMNNILAVWLVFGGHHHGVASREKLPPGTSWGFSFSKNPIILEKNVKNFTPIEIRIYLKSSCDKKSTINIYFGPENDQKSVEQFQKTEWIQDIHQSYFDKFDDELCVIDDRVDICSYPNGEYFPRPFESSDLFDDFDFKKLTL